jgi:predicted dehydrogenase
MTARGVTRIGLIGLGKHGARYARHLREDFPDLTLAAVARRDPEQLARAAGELGAAPYTDYRAMLAEAGLDAVIVVVPPTLHVEIVSCAAAAGVAVLLEKPAAPSLAAGRELAAVLRRHPVPLMVAQTLRYNAVVRALRGALDTIGPVRAMSFTQRFEPSRLGWLDDPTVSGGGIVLHTGVHGFDLMRWLSGLDADAITCQRASIHTRRTEDNFVATVSLGGGAALATVSCSRSAGARNGTIEIAGERATLLGDHVLNRAHRVVGTAIEPLPITGPNATVAEAVRDFVAALRAGGPLPITLDDGLRAVALADACAAAAASGRTVRVESVNEE